MEYIYTIKLPSFIRRTVRTDVLKAKLQQLDCKLHRVGRSRNWLLEANFTQVNEINNFIIQENENSWQWISKLLKQQYQHAGHEALVAIAKQLKVLTIAKLIEQTDCTLIEARRVLDELENFE